MKEVRGEISIRGKRNEKKQEEGYHLRESRKTIRVGFY